MLQYVKLKAQATLLRTVVWATGGMPRKPSPDQVVKIPTRDGAEVTAHVYRPADQSNGTKPERVIINWHGSGFVLALHGESDRFSRQLAEAGYTVYDCSYRLGPEYIFPTAHNDAEDTVKYVLDKVVGPNSAVVLSGSSAGGNMALCISAYADRSIRDRIEGVMAFYPADLSVAIESRYAPDDPDGVKKSGIPKPILHIFNNCYLSLSPEVKKNADGSTVPDPRFSPLASPVENFPSEILIVTAGLDTLAPEAEEMAKQLEAGPARSGNGRRHVVQKRFTGVDHAWDVNVLSHEKITTEGAEARTAAYQLALDLLNGLKWSI